MRGIFFFIAKSQQQKIYEPASSTPRKILNYLLLFHYESIELIGLCVCLCIGHRNECKRGATRLAGSIWDLDPWIAG